MPYLVLGVSQRADASGRAQRGPDRPSPRTIDMARQVASGLTAAHASGITHRDSQAREHLPDRRRPREDPRLRHREVGAASRRRMRRRQTVADTTATRAGVILGTIGYMAPEQATGRTVDFRCDQFAFGIVVYEMLSGRRAFQRPSHSRGMAAIVRDEPSDRCPRCTRRRRCRCSGCSIGASPRTRPTGTSRRATCTAISRRWPRTSCSRSCRRAPRRRPRPTCRSPVRRSSAGTPTSPRPGRSCCATRPGW